MKDTYHTHTARHPSTGWGWVTVVLIVVFEYGFGLAWAGVSWIYPSEIFPMRVKARALSISVTAQYVFNFGIVYLFPVINRAIGINNVCWMFTGE